jgi:hypothetical protein
MNNADSTPYPEHPAKSCLYPALPVIMLVLAPPEVPLERDKKLSKQNIMTVVIEEGVPDSGRFLVLNGC